MDILAHGIWSGLSAKAVNKKSGKKLSVKQTVFWGVFPDLFAFTIPFAWLFWNLIFGNINFSDIPGPKNGEPPESKLPVFRIASELYNYSHSLIIFLAVFGIVFLILRRPVWELFGWFLHILIDIPTHSYKVFPTPFLWPISKWKFNGFSWGAPWFLILNYTAIIIVYLILRKKKN